MKPIENTTDFITQRVIDWIYETADQDIEERRALIVERLGRLELTDQQLTSLLLEVGSAFGIGTTNSEESL